MGTQLLNVEHLPMFKCKYLCKSAGVGQFLIGHEHRRTAVDGTLPGTATPPPEPGGRPLPGTTKAPSNNYPSVQADQLPTLRGTGKGVFGCLSNLGGHGWCWGASVVSVGE